MSDFDVEASLKQFRQPEDIESGLVDIPTYPSTSEQVAIELKNIRDRENERQEEDLNTIKKYGGVATGLIALGGMGMMVLNRKTAEAAEKLYDKDTFKDTLKSESKDTLKGGANPRMNENEINKMDKYAKMVQVVYDRRKKGGTDLLPFFGSKFRQRDVDIPNQNVDGYVFERTGNDLTGAFVNDEKKEIVLAMRGLMPLNDRSDLLQFPSMSISSALEENKGDFFGSTFRSDRKMLEQVYLQAKELYPDYEVITTGHSRGGRGAIYLGRKYNLEFHSFSPATNRGDLLIGVGEPTEKGNHYYHYLDPVSRHMADKRYNSIEQHHISYNDRIYPHSLMDFQKDGEFHDKTIFVKQPRITRADIEDMERLSIDKIVARGVKDSFNFIQPEDIIDADMGRFADNNVPEINNSPILETGYGNVTDRGIFVNVNKRMVSKFNPDISLFDTIDTNNDNSISRQELKAFYPELSDEEIDTLFKLYDTDKSDSLNRSEFGLLKI